MKWPARDPDRWRRRFALFPRQIGPWWIWLRFYERRTVVVDWPNPGTAAFTLKRLTYQHRELEGEAYTYDWSD